ncbi:unnamed protein product [Amaranthus hypochondriacus]
MNFFKSVFADEDPETDQSSPTSNPQSSSEPESEPQPQSPVHEDQSTTPTWGFVGGLIKTFATKSESVLETYRRDLQEFSTGLKKETQVLKEVASSSLEVGASRAQESLESVGQAIDSLGSVVSQIIIQGKESDLDNPEFNSNANVNLNVGNSPGRKYSRFDAQLRAIQCDVNTYIEEYDDVGDFEKWKLGFNLEEKREEIDNLMKENGTMEGIYKRVVPNVVEHDVFWFRYYYRVYKLEQAESFRAKLVERANEDEDLSWDVDDEDDDNNVIDKKMVKDDDTIMDDKKMVNDDDNIVTDKKMVNDDDNVNDKKMMKDDGEDSMSPSKEITPEEPNSGGNEDLKEKGVVEKAPAPPLVEENAPSEGSKDSDISVVSSQPSSRVEEEDLGWDEIEDLGSDDDVDDKKGKQFEGSSSSPGNRDELRKRLSVAEEDEDLSWDIEDDDEPINKR